MRPSLYGIVALSSLLASTLLFNNSARANTQPLSSRLINGTPVPSGTYKEVIRISANGAGCTATVVGPRVILTAAHCAKSGDTATFSIDGKNYSAKIIRSPIYPGKDHDIAVGISSQEIDVEPAHVTQENLANAGMEITLLGYGCTQIGGGGGNDGILRYGQSVITSFSGYDMVSKKSGGAALCFGDSGGPAFIDHGGKKVLIGINSKGNIKDTNYNARLDMGESLSFLKSTASSEGIEICGVTSKCDDTPPPAPNCSISANPSTVKVDETVTLSLNATGEATSATIDGQSVSIPSGSVSVRPQAAGTFTVNGRVSGPGGSETCQTSYVVKSDDPPPPPDKKPECTLTASPEWIKLGERVTLSMTTKNKVTQALINGEEIGLPKGALSIEPTEPGNYTASGVVIGPGGTGTCWASYKVDGDMPPQLPNFSLVKTYCGPNELGPGSSQVKEVCLAAVKKDSSQKDAIVTEAIIVELRDGTQEVMPVINRKKKSYGVEELSSYANGHVNSGAHVVLDTRTATIKMSTDGQKQSPKSILGRAACNEYYSVEVLTPPVVHTPVPLP